MITRWAKQTLSVFIISTVFLFTTGVTQAETQSYKITDGFAYSAAGSTGNGRVIYYKIIGLNYQSGKVWFSLNPDGTGNPSVGDGFQIINQWPDTSLHTFTYDAYFPGCLSFKSNPDPIDVTSLFKQGLNGVLVRYLDWCYRPTTISQAYLVNTDIQAPTPTPTITPTPTATPTPTPIPFLELPWDYQSQNMTFSEAALYINTYFDHEYPLLSSILAEPPEATTSVIYYRGGSRDVNRDYSSHDGYDYGAPAKVHLGDPVLAAADGIATYNNTCGACGNMILIDHGNGYQTRYLHLQFDGLITTDPAKSVKVKAGDQIGKVGYTGHVEPAGPGGSHIHFGVFQDKNKDGDFSDNVPDGVTDPFGWQSAEPDPWEHYMFKIGNEEKSGNKSYYLWKHPLDRMNDRSSSENNTFTFNKSTLYLPPESASQGLNISIQLAPVTTPKNLAPLGVAYVIDITDLNNIAVTQFPTPFSLAIDFSTYDLSHVNPDTLSIYSSKDGESWNKEQTILDLDAKRVTTHVNHLTQFALLAERLDTVAPSTSVHLSGQEGDENYFRSDVSLSLAAEDNEGGLGVAYTLLKIHTPSKEIDWDQYKDTLTFSQEGDYIVEYFSVDNDDNAEPKQSIHFSIDKTPPEADIVYDLNIYDLVVTAEDNTNSVVIHKIDLGKQSEKFELTDAAGNTLTFLCKDREKGKRAVMNIYTLQYNDSPPVDLGDNKLTISAQTNTDTSLKSLNQLFTVKGQKKVELDYSSRTNETKVIVQINGQDTQKAQLNGVVLLRLSTKSGSLIDTY